MRIGIIGLAQSGKKTLFRLLTGAKAPPFHGKGEFPVGVSSVPDERVDRLAEVYRPKKTRYAEIEWVLFPSLPGETGSEGGGAKDPKARQKWLDAARLLDGPADGVCFLVRAFQDPGVYHEEGAWTPPQIGGDLEKLDLEFAFADLALIETRLERLAKETAKKTAAEREKQKDLLERFKVELEAGRPLRGLFTGGELTEADIARLSGLKFLTRTGALIALNVDEDVAADAEKTRETLERVPASAKQGREVVVFSAKAEAELLELCDELEDPAERRELMREFGTPQSASVKLARAALQTLGQISFLSANRNEVRAWLVHGGTTAAEAAGVVHTDFEQGFIRAEVMHVDELVRAGSEARLRDQGKLAIKGRDYVVQDGDILHILASS